MAPAVAKRAMAFAVVASLALGSAGCGSGNNGQDAYLLMMTAPIWVPVALISCATGRCGRVTDKSDEARANAEKTRSAAERGDAKAQYELGELYAYGRGVPTDAAEAAHWYRKSAEQGFREAQLRMGWLFELGRGVNQDFIQAHAWYSIAALAEGNTPETTAAALTGRDELEKRMSPEQIAEARKRAQEWKPNTAPAPPSNGTSGTSEVTR